MAEHYLPMDQGWLSTERRDDILETYFRQGFSHTEILSLVKRRHQIQLSLRQLKRILYGRNLYRRKNHSPINDVINCITAELSHSGECVGYRQIWKRLRDDHNIVVAREDIQYLMNIMDPIGVELRKQKQLKRRTYRTPGPNYYWHIDGNDKLKTYGLYIHGCIDGFSRKMLWLKVGSTNKDESVTATYFLDTIRSIGGVPSKIRLDPGTENGLTADIQTFLRLPEEKCVIFGKSTGNQRIEAWWSFLKKDWLCWWIDFFEEMIDAGLFDTSNKLHLECVRFCFTRQVQEELDRIQRLWNTHRMCPVNQSLCPPGRPDVIFNIPENHGAVNHLHVVNPDVLQNVYSLHAKTSPICEEAYLVLFYEIMLREDLSFAHDPEDCKKLYQDILDVVNQFQ
eukprot:Seg2658.1 transcript_id=Seg2658.1/GoldUCD/mRNA.D3Y31 product="hypothetical protein" protein_id=Seg2658.1/GoldUCD/D3Y31